MTVKPAILQRFAHLHAWVGLVAGFALFVAFYAGAITVFHQPLQQWADPHPSGATTLDDAQRLLDTVLARHDEARQHVGMTFPGYELAQPTAYWQAGDGSWRFATPGAVDGSTRHPGASLPELVNSLHYTLGIPVAGTWLMGLVSLLYGVALVSGVVIHLPRLAKGLFALRPGQPRKRFWQDAHNVVGVLGLPFHAMVAVTGAMLCLLFGAMLALNPLVYDGKLMAASVAAMDTAPTVDQAGVPAPMASLAQWRSRAIAAARAHGLDAFEPSYLKLANAGDAHAVVEITGRSPRALGSGAVALDASSGAVLAVQLPGARDANHATLAAAYALHFGDYGNRAIPWLYLLLGLTGAFVFYSGNLLWVASRRRGQREDRAAQAMARATVGVCLGVCVAISAAAVAAQCLPWLGLDAARGERWACFLTWALCALWASWRAPARATRELLWLAAIVTALAPMARSLAVGDWPWHDAPAPLAINLGALALAAGFAALAHAGTRHARRHTPRDA